METKPTKARLTIYIDATLHRWLWMQRAESGDPVSEIAEDLLVRGRKDRDRQARKRPGNPDPATSSAPA